MKKLQLVFALALVTIISSCSKDDATPIPAATNFTEIKISHIQAKNSLMTAANIQTTDANGPLWTAGTVMIFKTNSGVYGKFEVVNINPSLGNALTLNVVVFNADGTTKSTTNNLLIHGTFGCDLDIPAEDNAGLQSDFKWDRPTATTTFLAPKNGAIFLKYTF